MKSVTITTDDPDSVGEYYRNIFFDQRAGDLGCYSTFEVYPNVKSLPDRIGDAKDAGLDKALFDLKGYKA